MSQFSSGRRFRIIGTSFPRALEAPRNDEWSWLYNLSIDEWQNLIDANINEENSEEATVFYLVKPNSDQVLECPPKIAMKIYEDVLAGRKQVSAAAFNSSDPTKMKKSGNRISAENEQSYL